MSGYNFNHFTGKTRGKASRKKKIRMKQNHKDKYENRNKYKPFHITYKEVMQFETYIYFKTYTKRRWKSYF